METAEQFAITNVLPITALLFCGNNDLLVTQLLALCFDRKIRPQQVGYGSPEADLLTDLLKSAEERRKKLEPLSSYGA